MPALKRKAPAEKLRPRKRLQKNRAIKSTITASQVTINKLDPQIKLETNKEVAISITKTYSKVYKPKLYNEAINNPIHG